MFPRSHPAAIAAGLSAFSIAPALAQDLGSDTTLLGPIVIEAQNAWDPNADAADRAQSFHIGPEEIERLNPQNVDQLFSGKSSVQVGAGSTASKVYVNGIEETNLAVTVDGARENLKIFHHATTNTIDPALLKAVRVDPGVAAADAGPGALAGAIAYETVDAGDLLAPDANVGGFGTAQYGLNGNTFIGGLSAYGRHNGFEGLGYVRYGDGDNYDDGDGNEIPGTGVDLLSLLAKGAWESPTGHRFELSASQITDDADRPFRANVGSVGRPGEAEIRRYDLVNTDIVASYEATQAMGIWQPRAVLAWSKNETTVLEPWGSEGEGESWNGLIENRFPVGTIGSVAVGLDFYRDETSYTDQFTATATERATNHGLYAQARLHPSDPFRISFGVRGDMQEFEGIDGSTHDTEGLSGNISAEYDLNDMWMVSAGYSDVFGGIALNEPYIFNPAWVYDDLEAVRAKNMTGGLTFEHLGFTAGATIFQTEIENARDASYGAGPFLPFDFKSEGWRLDAGYAWASGFVRASFTDADVTSDGNAVDSDTLTYFGIPAGQTAAIEAQQRLDQYGLAFGGVIDIALDNDELAGGARPDFPGEVYEEIPGYTVVNLYAEYEPSRIENLTLRLEANNIFDEQYSDRASYGQEYGEVTPIAERGRSIVLAAKWLF